VAASARHISRVGHDNVAARGARLTAAATGRSRGSRKSEVGGSEGQIFFVSFGIFARDLILSSERVLRLQEPAATGPIRSMLVMSRAER
jgi:hypothetical protein